MALGVGWVGLGEGTADPFPRRKTKQRKKINKNDKTNLQSSPVALPK
jgi:hypothetical protein